MSCSSKPAARQPSFIPRVHPRGGPSACLSRAAPRFRYIEGTMSRSIHTTWRHLQELRRGTDADRTAKGEEAKRLRQELRRKHEIKAQIAVERGLPTRAPVAASPEAIPICVRDSGAYIHYPASPDDLRAVMARIPPGTFDGLSGIELCCGEQLQNRRSIRRPTTSGPSPSARRHSGPWSRPSAVTHGRRSPPSPTESPTTSPPWPDGNSKYTWTRHGASSSISLSDRTRRGQGRGSSGRMRSASSASPRT